MISSIHISLQVVKKAESLTRVGKNEQIVIDRYQEILEYLKKGDINQDELLSKRTRYGEHRIANCQKYNLSLGYRLVTIKKRGKLFISFLGTHEETDLWLRKNKNYLPSENNQLYPQTIIVNQNETPTPNLECEENDKSTVDEYESKLLNKIDGNALKDIFCGLYATQEG